MSITTILGFFAGVAFVVISISLDGNLANFYDPASIMIVLGGVIASIVISFPMNQLKAAMMALKYVYKNDKYDPKKSIDMIIEMASTARRSGLLALENEMENLDNRFLKKGMMLIIDGSNSEMVRNVLETEISFTSDRHAECISVFKSGSAYAPAYGMIGTLIGLINMLKKLDDPDSIGPSMAVALVTTFYGSILANLLFLPIAKKLQALSDREQLQNAMILEGILAIQDGENPKVIRDKLEAFVANARPNEQAEANVVAKAEAREA